MSVVLIWGWLRVDFHSCPIPKILLSYPILEESHAFLIPILSHSSIVFCLFILELNIHIQKLIPAHSCWLFSLSRPIMWCIVKLTPVLQESHDSQDSWKMSASSVDLFALVSKHYNGKMLAHRLFFFFPLEIIAVMQHSLVPTVSIDNFWKSAKFREQMYDN